MRAVKAKKWQPESEPALAKQVNTTIKQSLTRSSWIHTVLSNAK